MPAVQEAFVAGQCAAGQSLEFRKYAGFDHVGVVGPQSPLTQDIIAWTQARLAGEPQASGCVTVQR